MGDYSEEYAKSQLDAQRDAEIWAGLEQDPHFPEPTVSGPAESLFYSGLIGLGMLFCSPGGLFLLLLGFIAYLAIFRL